MKTLVAKKTTPSSDTRTTSLSEAAIQRGNEFGQDFNKWERELGSLVKRILSKRISNATDREDLYQQVWMRVWQSLDRYDPKKSQPQTWVMLITKRTIIDFLRRSNSRPERLDCDISTAESPVVKGLEAKNEAVDSGLLHEEDKANARAIVKSLPADQAALFDLKYLQNNSIAAAAEALGIPVGTAKSTISRVLAKLRREAA